ncbi:MAG: hypothetical protein OHK0046_13210 [Anaerolineae bacterium]
MQTVIALWGMARPFIMLSVILVYVLGALVAWSMTALFDSLAFGWGLAILLLVSLSIHYVNEYADAETDALTQPTPFSGGSGVLARGTVPRALALQAGWITLVLGLALAVAGSGAGVVPWASVPVLLLGALGGWMYSMPPLKLAWGGWGELDNAVLGGLLLPMYGYTVQTGRFDWGVALGFLPFTLLVFLNLLATTWPDRGADAQVGKYTLAARWSVSRLRGLYLLVALAALLMLVGLSANGVLPMQVIVASLLVVPFVVWAALRYTRVENPQASVMSMVVFILSQMAAWLVLM